MHKHIKEGVEHMSSVVKLFLDELILLPLLLTESL